MEDGSVASLFGYVELEALKAFKSQGCGHMARSTEGFNEELVGDQVEVSQPSSDVSVLCCSCNSFGTCRDRR